MKKTMVGNCWIDYLYVFIAGAIMGWSYEVILHLFQDGTFVNRGMLHGQWLPIYGTGCALIAPLKQWMETSPAQYFLICVAVSGTLEYMTSWVMEMVYHTRWWDYSSDLSNPSGRFFSRRVTWIWGSRMSGHLCSSSLTGQNILQDSTADIEAFYNL